MDHSIAHLIGVFTAAGWDKWETLKALTKVVCDHASPIKSTDNPRHRDGGNQLAQASHRHGRRPRGGDKVTVSETLELPGGVAPAWILTNTGASDEAGHGHYAHNAGGVDEWSLTWTKLDS